MQNIKVGDKNVGVGCPVYIVAEVGSNHCQKLNRAKRLIEIAAEAGCDAVKFQTFTQDRLWSPSIKKARELKGDTRRLPGCKEGETIYDLVKSQELPYEWHEELQKYAKKCEIEFLSTPFDEEAVDLLQGLGVPAFKIASSELNHLPLIRYAASKGKPMMLSTGMATLEDISDAVEAVKSSGNNTIIIMHCVSLYPASAKDVNAKAIRFMHEKYNVPVGFSDHTATNTAAILAVAYDACILEKHFTIKRDSGLIDSGPFSAEPKELAEYVKSVREAEEALGGGIKRPYEGELYEKNFASRSIHAAKDIPAGAVITEEMIKIVRPGLGIKPKYLEKVIGSETIRKISANEWIEWGDICGAVL